MKYEWKDVYKELPEADFTKKCVSTTVLVSIGKKKKKVYIANCIRSKDHKDIWSFFCRENGAYLEPTHWMYIPELENQ